jgi:predicted GNAT family acetyltransferase
MNDQDIAHKKLAEATHPLDRPVWSALTTRQTHLGRGDRLARRYHPDVAPFAAVEVETSEAFASLRQLIGPDDGVAVLSSDALEELPGLQAERIGLIHQMIAPTSVEAVDASDFIRLGPDAIEEMMRLTKQTNPGPFSKRTHETGDYIGLRHEGRLIAMAGQRMQLDGYVEISAVCVSDEHRGQGIAARLIDVLREEILRNGDVPFLHVFSHNHPAIALYERLGFTLRQVFNLTRLRNHDA